MEQIGTKLLFSTFHHPQTDGQTKVTNRNLGTLLRTMVNKHLKDWDLKLAHAEFACNWARNTTTRHSPFEVVYSVNPITLIELTSLPINLQLHKDA